MSKTAFREALLRHMDAASIGATRLAAETGVSKQVIDKLVQRRADGVKVDDAIRLAKFFGKTVNQMVGAEITESDQARIAAIATMLTDDERGLVLAQLEGLLAARRKH
jgi:hypothetical protein